MDLLLLFWAVSLIVLYLVYGFACSLERAMFEVTGLTFGSVASLVYTWVVANPVWMWRIADALFPKAEVSQPRYFM